MGPERRGHKEGALAVALKPTSINPALSAFGDAPKTLVRH
jgi:hypothetical protein